MASVFVYHVVGDLTVAKPELVEFLETETVEAAIKAIGESTESGIPVWKRRKGNAVENSEMRQQRFVGILNPMDIVAFLASDRCMEDQEKALKTPVSEIVVPDKSLLKEVDPATRLVDALEIMKHGVKRLLVPKSVPWRGFSKKFSILYNGRWLKNTDSSNNLLLPPSRPSTSTTTTTARITKFCCLSREDVVRFLINCLGALAPIPLSSISALGAINSDYCSVPSSSPAIEAINKRPHDPNAIAIVEPTSDGQHDKIIGEISACKLWSCDYLATSYALAHLSAGQFVMGVEDNMTMRSNDDMAATDDLSPGGNTGPVRLRKFNSRSLGFYSNSIISPTAGAARSMYRGRSVPLTCKPTSSLAAVMAQMLSHRATHVWVIEGENDDVLVGVVGYADILRAVTLPPPAVVP
ncbi:hypothetical protein V2J09_007746 [Rumex salicifolius]